MKDLLTFQKHCNDINKLVLLISGGNTGSKFKMALDFGVSECTIKNWIEYIRDQIKHLFIYI